ncbi:Dihydrosphingosine 1-phosphate phosphatase [Psilocybe cubensis]|uniref:Dihydrosphingosine 1-phosphate phosphatase n=1 Tax=Psilocybe cubensis TaxID=181762 RepID=A0ACB8GNT2_PSICU|nr:Dihydrosphingosine 1-phosphate phosphatase [Psilocybe cubensis]KAH9477378.1 Dihydrosphingosine 1-phosphate phosphatase [Psilocybe cubensis]
MSGKTPAKASSPAPTHSRETSYQNGVTHDLDVQSLKQRFLTNDVTPGLQGKDVYDSTLSWWRAGIRRKLVATVQWESWIIAAMQEKIRTPWLDAYFVYSSILGTHTFFMILLPALFFFGYDETGRALLAILGLGIYGSSVIKDLFCSPRPFAPPVTRLTIGSHHLEYGFPSTHSTNSVSIALIFFAHVHRLASTPIPSSQTIISTITNGTSTIINSSDTTEYMISPRLYYFINFILFIYAFSVVFGRLYTAMHSFTDCITGILLGAGIWWAHTDWAGAPYLLEPSNPLNALCAFLGFGTLQPSGALLVFMGQGLAAGKWIEKWIQYGGWEVPLILIPLCLFAVHVHPQPVDDCPCFEDAIAILSVVLGSLVSRWAVCYSQAGMDLVKNVIMPGSGWILEAGQWVQVEREWNDVLVWWTFAAIKMSFGILVIFVWRLLAKSALHIILPPTFRLLARAFQLPHRRFYTPATEYKSVPSEFHSSADGGGFELHPIPSVIDLPSAGNVGIEIGGIGSGVEGHSGSRTVMAKDLKMRSGNGHRNANGAANGNAHPSNEKAFNGKAGVGAHRTDKESTGKDGQPDDVRHYDADVLTKVIVYAGIAVIACEVLPLAFDLFGWGVGSHVTIL